MAKSVGQEINKNQPSFITFKLICIYMCICCRKDWVSWWMTVIWSITMCVWPPYLWIGQESGNLVGWIICTQPQEQTLYPQSKYYPPLKDMILQKSLITEERGGQKNGMCSCSFVVLWDHHILYDTLVFYVCGWLLTNIGTLKYGYKSSLTWNLIPNSLLKENVWLMDILWVISVNFSLFWLSCKFV